MRLFGALCLACLLIFSQALPSPVEENPMMSSDLDEHSSSRVKRWGYGYGGYGGGWGRPWGGGWGRPWGGGWGRPWGGGWGRPWGGGWGYG
uniref:Glycine-rich RNA-binding protein GRP1A-like n=1 Tax=Heterorhabditis bacteriophora TaxID=37862 RepID=A0A1I7WRS2_HETBA